VDDTTIPRGYAEARTYVLRLVVEGRAPEARALVAEREGRVVGCVLFGAVAGAVGTGRVQWVTVADDARRSGIATGLCDAAVADLTDTGVRSIVAEMPEDVVFAAGRALLTRCGFTEAARVPDYYRDEVDLVVLQRILAGRDY